MSLDDLRKKIDELDRKLVSLLNERARVVVDIGKLKTRTDKPVYAPDREKAVFERISQAKLATRCEYIRDGETIGLETFKAQARIDNKILEFDLVLRIKADFVYALILVEIMRR